MKIKTFLTAALTFGAFLTVTTVNGAAVDRKDIIEKAQLSYMHVLFLKLIFNGWHSTG